MYTSLLYPRVENGRRLALAVLLVPLALVACQKGPEKESGLGEQVASAAADTRVLKDVQEAANAVLRSADDCEAAKAALPEANRRMDEAASKLTTATGRTTLDALRTQVATVSRNCP